MVLDVVEEPVLRARQLATYLAMSPDCLYKLRTYSVTFTREQVVEWAERRMSNGGRIRYHHLAAIMVVKSPRQRLDLVERVFTESLSVRALRKVIDGDDGEAGTGTSSARVPKSLLRELARLIHCAQHTTKELDRLDKGLQRQMQAADTELLQPMLRNKAVIAHGVLIELGHGIASALERLSAALPQKDPAARGAGATQ
jgi:hypothetical protein